jgi:hypothetical protein
MADRIIENIYSDEQVVAAANPTEPTLDEMCAAKVRRRGRRGRPNGTGRKHPERCAPKTFRYFSPLAQGLLTGIRLTDPEQMQQTEAEIVEEALVRFARSLSNRNPALLRQLKRAGR